MRNKFVYLSLIVLVMTCSLYAKPYKGAEYRTKEAFLYGRFEVRLKSANTEGILSSFFTYAEITSTSEWNEIDIEVLGRYPDDVQFNTITPGQTNHVKSQPVTFNPHTDYHTYAFEWTPAYVAWFIDDVEVARQTGAHIFTLTRAQKLMMNVWIPTYPDWVGPFYSASLPAFAYYDWISVYTYTPGQGNYGTGNNFTLKFKDELNSWDTTIWEKATHTFGGNDVDFIHDNIVFENGKMILCITDATNIGYKDVAKPTVLWSRMQHGKVLVRFSEEVEKSSAETLANYVLSGVTIKSARLFGDNKTVELEIVGYDNSVNYNLIVKDVKDTWKTPNVMSAKGIALTKETPLSFPLKVNVGGGKAYDFVADQEFKPTTEYGYSEGSTGSFNFDVQGTTQDSVYRTERAGLGQYIVRVPNGVYKARLLMAENYFDNSGKRVTDIYIESKKIATVDVFAAKGKSNAYELSADNISVTDGQLTIQFASIVDRGILNGLIVEQIAVSNDSDRGNTNPSDFQLKQNFPNPFNGETRVEYAINRSGNYRFKVHNTLGELIIQKNLGYKEAGTHSLNVSTEQIGTSGVFLYTIDNGEIAQTRKMIVLK